MANTFTALHYHVVFSTKLRQRWLVAEVQERVWAYLGGMSRQNRMQTVQIGGTDDHVHLLLGMPPTASVSEMLRLVKGGSSKWIKETFPGCRDFAWQDGYGAFTVSQSQLPEVKAYIINQREHHRVKTFQEEFLGFLERHGISYEPKYLWD